MNGWVDVEKDAWVFFLQGNFEVAPTLLYLVKAGVPIEDAVYFVSQPLVREYVKEQRLARSMFADVLRRKQKPALVNFGAATTTSGQNATPAPGQSVSQTISTSLASLRDTAVNNPAATKVALNIALSAFPALGAIIAVASFFARNVAPAVAPATNETAAETDRLARFAEEAQAREAEAEAAQRQTDSEGKSERAAQFGGPDADADGSYSNSLRDSPSDAGADSGP
jgi:hypothetical protein